MDERHEKLKTSVKALRDFILSSSFLDDFIQFEKLLGEYQDNLITLVEVIQVPIVGMPPSEAKAPTPETPPPSEEKEESFSLPKALVAVAAIIVSGIAVQQGYLPVQALIGVIGMSLGLLLVPYIKDGIKGLLQRKTEAEEEKALGMRLEDWVHESIAKIRAEYVAARFLTKIQSQTKADLPEYSVLGIDEALYDRKKYFGETLPSEFLSRIGEIVIACEKNYWARKTLLINAITISRQASIRGGERVG